MLDANLAVRRDGGALQDRFYNRAMFPIRDERGRAIGLGGRVFLKDDPQKGKYVNTSETPIFHKGSNLFALDVAKSHITAQMEAVVMEGYTDVIASHEAGIRNAVAPLGTAFRQRHVKMLSRFLTAMGERVSRGRIVCLFDGDEAGLKAAERAMQFVGLTTAGMYCVVLPDGKDPAEYLASDGPDAMRARIAEAVPLVRFVVDRHLDRLGASTPEQRALALADVVQAMGPIKGTALADEYVEYVAARLMTDVSTVRGALAAVRWTPPRDDEDDAADASPAVVEQPALGPMDGGDPRDEASRRPPVRLLPGDERAVRIEREVLATMAASVDEARPFADRIARISWTDPDHEAIAWSILASPEGSGAADVLTAAEEVCPRAAHILADGTARLDGEAPVSRTLDILLDDLEMRSIRRRIDQGRALLRTASDMDAGSYDALFADLTDLQRRLRELEAKVRSLS